MDRSSKLPKIVFAILLGQIPWILLFCGFEYMIEKSIVVAPVIIGMISAFSCGWWSMLSGATFPLALAFLILKFGVPTGEGGMFIYIVVISSGVMLFSSLVSTLIRKAVIEEIDKYKDRKKVPAKKVK